MIKQKSQTYYLAKTWKRITARIIDIILASLIPGIIALIWTLIDKSNVNNWKSLLLMIFINFIILILYFIIFQWLTNGQTIGKKILSIKLAHKEKEKIPFKSILAREIILVIFPVTLSMIGIFLLNFFANTTNSTLEFCLKVLFRIIYTFIFAWYLGIMIVVKIDKNHQLFYDRKFEIYTIEKKPTLKIINKKELKNNAIRITFNDSNKHLPGNINQKDLDEIKNL